MNNLEKWSDLLLQSIQSFGNKIIEGIPSFLGLIAIVVFGWLLAKFITSAISKLLKVSKFDVLAEKINISSFLEKANLKLSPSKMVGKFFYWIFMLFVITSASDAMGWDAVSKEISKLLNIMPKLLTAIVIFILGSYIANFTKDIISGATGSMGIGTGKIISKVAYFLIMAMVSLTALEQAGIDTSIITSNLLLVLGAILITASISYGLASKDILSNILSSFYIKKTFAIGQIIEINGLKGEIVSANNISVTIRNEEGDIVIPSHKIVNSEVKILKKY